MERRFPVQVHPGGLHPTPDRIIQKTVDDFFFLLSYFPTFFPSPSAGLICPLLFHSTHSLPAFQFDHVWAYH